MAAEIDNKRIFEDLPVRAALRTMVVPTIVSQIILLIYNMADTFFVGRAADPYMVAGVSLILPIFNISFCLVNLAGVGGGTLVSRLLGKKEPEEARRVSMFSLYLGLTLALLFSVGVGVFLDPLLLALGARENSIGFARQYTFCVIVLGAVPNVVSSVLANLLRSTGNSKRASFGITMGGVLNMALDPLFMFLILPPGNEVLGVGVATLLSMCVVCVFFLVSVLRLRGKTVVTLDPRVGLPRWRNMGAVFAVGAPAAIATLLFDVDYIVIDRLMIGYSEVAMAAIGIVLKVERLPLNVGVGICQGVVPLVAYNFAARNRGRMDAVIRDSRSLGLIVAAGSILLYEVFAYFLIRFFIPEPETVALATRFLRARVLATPFMFLSFFTVHLFQAFGRGETALLLGVVRWAALNIPLLFLLHHFFGIYGVVWGQVVGDCINVALSFFVYYRYRRTRLDREMGPAAP